MVTDAEFDELKANVADLKKAFADFTGKAGAIKVATDGNSAIQGKVKQFPMTARHHFILASYRDKAKKVRDDQADLIADLWAIKSCVGGSYNQMLMDIFPMLPLDVHQERRITFFEKSGILQNLSLDR